MKQGNGLFGCLLAIIILLLVVGCSFGISCLITWAIIWVSNGLFNYDLSDKFWYIFVIIFFILPLLKGIFTVKVNGGK